MPVDLSDSFAAFDAALALPQSAIRRIESASTALAEFLIYKLGLAEEDVFLQGSYPNGTAIRPVEGGEYDVDVVCRMGSAHETADEVLDRLEGLLRADGRYKDRIVAKKPCIRLEYAEDDIGRFHLDVVPVRRAVQAAAPLEAPRRGEGWHDTAPAEYTDWCRVQGEQFARTVKALKRWRDEQQSVRNAIKSIVLQVLVSRYMPDEPDDAHRLHRTITAMYGDLSTRTEAPVISNPVLPSEDLAARWATDGFRDFVAELDEARGHTERAVTTSDRVEATDAWQEVLGSAFPAAPSSELGIRLSDDSHARDFGSQGWIEALDSRYGVRVTAAQSRARRSPYLRPHPNNGPLVFRGRKLRFQAQTRGADDVEIWWQVSNTGLHARSDGGLRGEYFRARKANGRPSHDPKENWESTSYTGTHWIRAVLVKDRRVVAVSEKFVVNVYNKSHRFGL